MPPKDITPHGSLMFSTDGGETMMPLGKISETIITDDIIPDDQTVLPFVKMDDEITFSCKFKMENSATIFLVTGKWPSNNWLKMHGIPMRRRYRRRK